jgi:dTDP-glucose 4,6-dehydratase
MWDQGCFERLRGAHVVVTGGAGFLGSHLCERLVNAGADVVAIDNLVTGREENLDHLVGRPGFRFIRYDVTDYLHVPGPVQYVLHFASPASPMDYMRLPIQTLKVGALGTHKALGLARAKGATFMLASTSEVYGDPQVNPQPESYWGHVNPVGPRGVYDEGKRFAEAMAFAYHRYHDVPVRVARIFNTYGERMRIDDGRAVPTFIAQALAGEPLTVHGDGSQTRSLCYVADEIDGLLRLLVSDHTGPMNIGNPHEVTVRELAETIIDVCGSSSELRFTDRPQDDPEVRRPETSLSEEVLGWRATVPLRTGLRRTVEYFREPSWTATTVSIP